MGHNLGMSHDFKYNGSTRIVRKSKDGTKCTYIGGWMDYAYKVKKWSKCSVEDFSNYYSDVVAKNGKFCLEPGKCGTVI